MNRPKVRGVAVGLMFGFALSSLTATGDTSAHYAGLAALFGAAAFVFRWQGTDE